LALGVALAVAGWALFLALLALDLLVARRRVGSTRNAADGTPRR
jgi:hypothetical protein